MTGHACQLDAITCPVPVPRRMIVSFFTNHYLFPVIYYQVPVLCAMQSYIVGLENRSTPINEFIGIIFQDFPITIVVPMPLIPAINPSPPLDFICPSAVSDSVANLRKYIFSIITGISLLLLLCR